VTLSPLGESDQVNSEVLWWHMTSLPLRFVHVLDTLCLRPNGMLYAEIEGRVAAETVVRTERQSRISGGDDRAMRETDTWGVDPLSMTSIRNRRCVMLANSAVVKRSLVAVITVLVVGLVFAVVVNRPSAGTGSEAAVAAREDSPASVAARGADFDFLDHELRYAGGYELRSLSIVPRGADFDFLDHELRYAGGYELRSLSIVPRGADFDFLDHELRYAGNYGLRPAAVAARGADFEFLDHELRYAGDYGLVPVALGK
jgi:hypothetical protein